MDNITFEQLPAVVGELFVKIENIERLLQQPGKTDDLDELFTIQQASTFFAVDGPDYLWISQPVIYSGF